MTDTDDSEPREEPLRSFLMSELSEQPVELDEGEVISDAIVLFRVVSVSDEGWGGVGEYYRYTVTKGVNLSMAFGMLGLASNTMNEIYQNWLQPGPDDEDDD